MASSRRTIVIVAAAGIAAWVVNAVILWAAGGALGHDEAQYAIAAQDLVEGRPIVWNYLPIGMDVVALPGVLLGGSERALHVFPLVLGIGYLAAAGLVARAVFGDAVAAWTICVLAAATSIARRAVELLSDLPATACLLAGTGLIVVELTREPAPRRRLLLAAPCFAAAFYVRYGSVFPIAVVSGAAIVVGWRAILRRPGLVLATAALFVALLVPFFRLSLRLTGRPLGVFGETSDALGTAPMGSSLVTYLTTNPILFYGVAITPVMLVGLAAIRRARDPRVRALWLIGVGHVVVMGLTPVPQSRYIFFGMTLLAILGVDELRRLVTARPPAARRVLGRLATAVVASSWVVAAFTSRRILSSRERRMGPTYAAIAAVRADAAGAPCQVIARRTTLMQWYTGCVAVYEAQPDVLARERVYHVLEPGGEYQPAPVEGRPGVPRVILEQPGKLIVTRLDPPR